MHSLFGTARGSNLGPFDPKLDTLTTTRMYLAAGRSARGRVVKLVEV